jgi:hypothetical protein
MAFTKRKTMPSGKTTLFVEVFHRDKDGFLCGIPHTYKGWHWHWMARTPDTFKGQEVVISGVVQGPFDTEEAAIANAREHGAFFDMALEQVG